MMEKVWWGITAIWYYLLGNICIFLRYDRKYTTGRYFKFGGAGYVWATRCFYHQTIGGRNDYVPWPVSPHMGVTSPQNIEFDPDDMQIFQLSGNYFQAIGGKLKIGKGTLIAVNVGLITANHDIHDVHKHSEGRDIVIGKKCWIGMNSVILPGVTLGDNTVVGAGSVVTKSFPEGHCVIAGNPAKLIKTL